MTIDQIADVNHRVGDAENTVTVSSTVIPVECEPEIVYAMTISSASTLITFDALTKTVKIATTNDLNEAGDFTVTVTATIGSTLKSTEDFLVTIFDCSTLTIDKTKFTSPALTYIVGSA